MELSKLDQIKEVRFSYEGSYQVTFEVAGEVGVCWIPTDPLNRHHKLLLEYFCAGGYPLPPHPVKLPRFLGIRKENWASLGWFVGIMATVGTLFFVALQYFYPLASCIRQP
jgi:hypothetical protein